MSFPDLAGREAKSKAGAVALALYRYRCICKRVAEAVRLLPKALSHRHIRQYAVMRFCPLLSFRHCSGRKDMYMTVNHNCSMAYLWI